MLLHDEKIVWVQFWNQFLFIILKEKKTLRFKITINA
jgi:hypothetical protein